MSFLIDGNTILNPRSVTREFIETATENTNWKGKTRRKVVNTKERFTLVYTNLTQAQVNALLAYYVLNKVVVFRVDEDNLRIGPTDCLMDISNRVFVDGTKRLRENLSIVLTEVT